MIHLLLHPLIRLLYTSQQELFPERCQTHQGNISKYCYYYKHKSFSGFQIRAMWVLKDEETHPFLFYFMSDSGNKKTMIFTEFNVSNWRTEWRTIEEWWQNLKIWKAIVPQVREQLILGLQAEHQGDSSCLGREPQSLLKCLLSRMLLEGQALWLW